MEVDEGVVEGVEPRRRVGKFVVVNSGVMLSFVFTAEISNTKST